MFAFSIAAIESYFTVHWLFRGNKDIFKSLVQTNQRKSK
jgi:hypothetical protein